MQANIGEPVRLDPRQNLDHALLERLAADQRHARIILRLPNQMLATAEADLQPDLRPERERKPGERICRIDPNTRQHGVDQALLQR